jgi:phospholipid transport system transporter-binding protein
MSAAALVAGERAGVYRVTGSLTFETVPALAAEGAELDGDDTPLRIDLSAIDRVDSAGLAVLVDWLASVRSRGQDMVFEGPPAQLLAIARVSGVDGLLGFSDASDEQRGGVNDGS